MKTDKARKTQRDGLKEDTKSPGLSEKDIGPGLTQLKECHWTNKERKLKGLLQ